MRPGQNRRMIVSILRELGIGAGCTGCSLNYRHNVTKSRNILGVKRMSPLLISPRKFLLGSLSHALSLLMGLNVGMVPARFDRLRGGDGFRP